MAENDRTTGLVGNAGMKVPVRAASTAVLVLSGEQTVDGVALVTNDRVLVKNQASSVDNGVYVVDTGSWERAKDADGTYDFVQGSLILVYGGTANGNKLFKCTTTSPVVVDTDALTFAALSAELTGSSKVIWCGTATGTANALVLTPTTVVAAADLQAGLSLVFKAGAAGNSAATTIAVSGNAAIAAQNDGAACIGGEIVANKWYRATLDGSGAAFQIEQLAPALLASLFTAAGQILVATAAGVVGASPKSFAPGGRLTLRTVDPVTATDVTAANTMYYTPYKHDTIEIYNGAGWIPYTFTERSQLTTDATKSPAAVANNSAYDYFVWNDAGTLRCTRGPAWSSLTARGAGAGTTELELFEGRLVNKVAITNGPAARRGVYVGSASSDGAAQLNDSLLKRNVWNSHNRVVRSMRVLEATDSWNYSVATIRQANGSAANQLEFTRGLDEDAVDSIIYNLASNSATVGTAMNCMIGLDSTTAMVAGCILGLNVSQVNGQIVCSSAHWTGLPGIGRHTLVWLEYSDANLTTTFMGDLGLPLRIQTGMHAEVIA